MLPVPPRHHQLLQIFSGPFDGPWVPSRVFRAASRRGESYQHSALPFPEVLVLPSTSRCLGASSQPQTHLMHMPYNNFNMEIKEQKLASFVLLLTAFSRHYYFFFVSCHFLSVRNLFSILFAMDNNRVCLCV